MKKRLFQVLDEMNVNDEKNKTATLPCSFTMVEAKSNKLGGVVSMGVEAHILQKIFLGDLRPMLVVLDMKEYNRVEALPVNDELQAALARAERAERALKDFARQIKMHCNKMGIRSVVIQCIANRMEELDITDALTTKTGDDEG